MLTWIGLRRSNTNSFRNISLAFRQKPPFMLSLCLNVNSSLSFMAQLVTYVSFYVRTRRSCWLCDRTRRPCWLWLCPNPPFMLHVVGYVSEPTRNLKGPNSFSLSALRPSPLHTLVTCPNASSMLFLYQTGFFFFFFFFCLNWKLMLVLYPNFVSHVGFVFKLVIMLVQSRHSHHVGFVSIMLELYRPTY